LNRTRCGPATLTSRSRVILPAAAWVTGVLVGLIAFSGAGVAQIAPSRGEIGQYQGLFAAALANRPSEIAALVAKGEKVDTVDGYKRTPLHVAAYFGKHEAMRALVAAGANPNALENDRYDIVTIAAVANDLPTMKLALELGCKATNITSRYDGTALIAAAHLGHAEIVNTLIKAGAPLDHVNNLHWTALIESIVLGNGGLQHIQTLKYLVDAGASLKLTDRGGATPLALARSRGYQPMVRILESAGAR
jgi:uncharacterized protein